MWLNLWITCVDNLWITTSVGFGFGTGTGTVHAGAGTPAWFGILCFGDLPAHTQRRFPL
jgi:hypothetical protein